MRQIARVAALFAASAIAQAHAADIAVQGAWARATAASAQTGAVYLTITNKGAPDKLVGVTTPVAATAKLHETVKTGDVVGMRPIDSLALPASGPTVLAPGGYHIMLMGLKDRLVEGKTFPITLTFAGAGTMDATVAVEAAGAGGPMQDMGPGHDMDRMPGTAR